MRISDWSSDVCSSDLAIGPAFSGAVIDQLIGTAAPAGMVTVSGGAVATAGDSVGVAVTSIGLSVQLHPSSFALILRSEEHTSELQSLMRISYAVFCLKKKKIIYKQYKHKKISIIT